MGTLTRITGTGANSNDGGAIAWTNPENITASDDSLAVAASVTTANASQLLLATNFDFSGLPDNATLLSVTARFEVHRSGLGTPRFESVKAWDGAAVAGDEQSNDATISSAVTLEEQGSGVWGYWTVANLKDANQGVALKVIGNSGTSSFNVDAVWLIVYFSDESGARSALSSRGRPGRLRSR